SASVYSPTVSTSSGESRGKYSSRPGAADPREVQAVAPRRAGGAGRLVRPGRRTAGTAGPTGETDRRPESFHPPPSRRPHRLQFLPAFEAGGKLALQGVQLGLRGGDAVAVLAVEVGRGHRVVQG